jgi:GcrA cell cycle regulator
MSLDIQTQWTEWNRDDVQKMAQLWNDGVSASAIARRFGSTKSAVSGLAFRNRELFKSKKIVGSASTRKANPSRAGMTLTQKREAVKDEAAAFVADLYQAPEPEGYDAERLAVAKPLHELANCECRWPMNNGGPFLFCGDKREKGSYCMPHHVRSLPKRAVEVE